MEVLSCDTGIITDLCSSFKIIMVHFGNYSSRILCCIWFCGSLLLDGSEGDYCRLRLLLGEVS